MVKCEVFELTASMKTHHSQTTQVVKTLKTLEAEFDSQTKKTRV